ncbi:peptidoglycan-recognition protein SC2-like [Littorina saxatilis]|uniref:Uncharacterized protein n=1 Tax=Littorina saxatilis TaxID=31220 RepID=A0AAN9C0S3_9CAEN
MKLRVCIILLVVIFARAEGSDVPCQNQGGSCHDVNSYSCPGTYHSGLCSGTNSRKCCISSHDAACSGQGGTCQEDSHSCSGTYHSGLCSGANSRKCCVSSGSSSQQTGSGSCPHIISRVEWGARAPKHHIGNMAGPAQYVFIHHGSSPPCSTETSCKAKVKAYQDYHLDGHGWTDIGYNFVVGEDGNAYMARGWTEIGAHTQGYNSVGIAICVIGDFNSRVPNDAALNTIKQLISCGLAGGYISSSYTLKGHRDVGSTDCPGTALYNLIHSWPHYKSGTQRYG